MLVEEVATHAGRAGMGCRRRYLSPFRHLASRGERNRFTLGSDKNVALGKVETVNNADCYKLAGDSLDMGRVWGSNSLAFPSLLPPETVFLCF